SSAVRNHRNAVRLASESCPQCLGFRIGTIPVRGWASKVPASHRRCRVARIIPESLFSPGRAPKSRWVICFPNINSRGTSLDRCGGTIIGLARRDDENLLQG
ncbi:MAG: hypothetical protein K2Z80_28760, partial [Xanthobacteraceae bacterium]|nr:hypothetical protein [Xanthobacteraceae bacterium]